MSTPSFVVITGMGILLVEMQRAGARNRGVYCDRDIGTNQAGRNRVTARNVMKAKNASTMSCTAPNTGPDGGAPGAIACSAGTFRKVWITSTKQLRYSETSAVTT